MQSLLNLLEKALAQHPAPYWHQQLNLNRKALYNAKIRGHINPAIAGAIAEKLGENIDRWMVVAALGSEKKSGCKDRMLKHYQACQYS